MESAQVSALIAASAAIAAMALAQGFQWLRERGSRSSTARTARADRLRELYADVLTAAIRVTPAGLQYRPSSGPAGPSPEAADSIRARLSIEAEEDGQAVLTAFIGVVNFSGLYEGEAASRARDSERVPLKDLQATEQLIRKNMTALEEACRARLAALTNR